VQSGWHWDGGHAAGSETTRALVRAVLVWGVHATANRHDARCWQAEVPYPQT
jgi:hypothetical protein